MLLIEHLCISNNKRLKKVEKSSLTTYYLIGNDKVNKFFNKIYKSLNICNEKFIKRNLIIAKKMFGGWMNGWEGAKAG